MSRNAVSRFENVSQTTPEPFALRQKAHRIQLVQCEDRPALPGRWASNLGGLGASGFRLRAAPVLIHSLHGHFNPKTPITRE